MNEPEKPIRVLVVDDSAFMRRALTRLIDGGRRFEVVGIASNGREALARIAELHPDVVTMDVEMPEMDGVQALEAIMARHPVPIVMFSSITVRGADVTMRCLELGAVDFITKPSGSVSEDLGSIRYIVWQKLRSAAGAHLQPTLSTPVPAKRAALTPHNDQKHMTARRLVAIGASTGGPRALLEVLMPLPGDLPAGLLVVQHMPPHFTAAMAQRFNDNCALQVREAEVGDRIEEGVALIAPGGRHLRLAADGKVTLTDEPPVWGVRPSVDVMMEGVAQVFGSACLGVILTGMGRDGTTGLTMLKHAGASTIGQDEASCVVYGMPRAAAEAGVVDTVLPLHEIAGGISKWCHLTKTGTPKEAMA